MQTLGKVLSFSSNNAAPIYQCNHFILFNIHRTYGSFTMETILATAFGRIINLQKGESDSLAEAASFMFDGALETNTFSQENVVMVLSESYSR